MFGEVAVTLSVAKHLRPGEEIGVAAAPVAIIWEVRFAMALAPSHVYRDGVARWLFLSVLKI